MKIIKIFCISFIIISITSCGLTNMANKYNTVQYNVKPEILETHGGKISIKIDGKFPEKYFAKKATVEVTPVLVYNNGEESFKKITLQGEEANGGEKTIFYTNGGSFSYEDIIPYNNNMKDASLEIRATGEIITSSEKQVQVFPSVKIAHGTIVTPTRILNNEELANDNHKYEHETILEERATIYFLVNQSNIRTTEKSDEDIEKLKTFAGNGYKTHSIEIVSYASPEGSVERNDNVSKNRMKSTEKYTKNLLKKLKVDGADDQELYTKNSIGEDWDGFESIIKKSQLKDKRKINNLLNSIEDVEKREKELRDMTEIYDAVKNDVLPQLRKATIIIRAYEPKKTDEEIAILSSENPVELTIEELLFSATLTNEQEKQSDIYKAIIELHDDWRAYNNLACIYIEQGKLDEAMQYLDKSEKVYGNKKNDNILTNKGIIYSRKGNLEKAQQAFSQSNTSELNQAILNIRKGEYDKAVRYFKNKSSYNAILAKIMNGDYNVTCNENTAACYYLNAISSSRKGDVNATVDNLKKAISIDSSYKDEARIDLEFVNLRENEKFISLIQ